MAQGGTGQENGRQSRVGRRTGPWQASRGGDRKAGGMQAGSRLAGSRQVAGRQAAGR